MRFSQPYDKRGSVMLLLPAITFLQYSYSSLRPKFLLSQQTSKRILTCLLACTLFFSSYAESIYSLSVKNIDGKTISLSSLKGKKLLLVVLPLSSSDTVLPITALKAVQSRHPSLTVIGILSVEAGFKKSDMDKIRKRYKDMPPGFILTEILKASKATGNEQAPLLQWLTHRQRNTHFDNDVKGPGFKFFVDERGELYGALDPGVKISSPFIDRVIQRK